MNDLEITKYTEQRHIKHLKMLQWYKILWDILKKDKNLSY